MSLLNTIFGSHSDKELHKAEKKTNSVLELEEEYSKLSDADLQHKTVEFKERLANGETIDDIEIEAFATVREASKRVLGMSHYPVQLTAGFALNAGNITELSTGEGKSVCVNTKIPTPNGWRLAGDIKVGDTLFDNNGKPTVVTAVYPQGKIETYEFVLKDGRKVKCGKEHLWTVIFNRDVKKYRRGKMYTLSVEELLKIGNVAKRGFYFSIPMAKAVEYPKKDLEIDPYVMGALLGDGCKNKANEFQISSNDEEIPCYIASILGASEYKKKKNGYTWYFYKSEKSKNCHGLAHLKVSDITKNEEYISLITDTYCYDKYIPEEYKTASIEQRWHLIQGLMDTDGNIYRKAPCDNKPRYNMQYATSSEKLKDDFMEVIYSLGLTASCRVRTLENGKIPNAKHNQYIIKINTDNSVKKNFFRMTRKKSVAEECENISKKKNYSCISVVDIKDLNELTEQVCFTVDSPDHLFLVDNYIVTHNTLVATCPAYLNALTGEPVMVITVNDYLAKRDSEWMGKVYKFLGLTVGLIVHEKSDTERREAYNCDIVYATNVEVGFDYLRDNMAYKLEDMVQRGLGYVILDEADSILIDEARTPLIISGFNGETDEGYKKADAFVKGLNGKIIVEMNNGTKLEQATMRMQGKELKEQYAEYDYIVEEKTKQVQLTDKGITKAEEYYGIENLSDPENITITHFITRALKAYGVFHKDVDYVVNDSGVQIVDESTGRIMQGRRYSEGIHQAIEAKEGVKIAQESKTMASITYQNLFRKFKKLSGMTGTAKTDEEELLGIYNMYVVTVPTNKPVIRKDNPDKVYLTALAKYNALVDKVQDCHIKGQPVLIGTTSVEKSDIVHDYLEQAGIPHKVLNAKYHEKEAEIIAQAGQYGAVTVATNMAGRGTDIILGGNPEYLALAELKAEGYSDELIVEANSYSNTSDEEILNIRKLYTEKFNRIKDELAENKQKVIDAGGLFVLGTERHESRRIDNQLRGRSGRQGDAGESLFMLSLDDDLLRLFGDQMRDKIIAMSEALHIPKNYPIDAGVLGKGVEKAQQRIESKYYGIRKSTLEFDEVMAKQRDIIYEERRKLLEGKLDYKKTVEAMMSDAIDRKIDNCTPTLKHLTPDAMGYIIEEFADLNKTIKIPEYSEDELLDITVSDIKDIIKKQAIENYEKIYEKKPVEYINDFTKRLLLFLLDNNWQEMMVDLDELKKGINFMALAQKDPLKEYQNQAFEMFDNMMYYIREEVLNTFMGVYELEILSFMAETPDMVIVNEDNTNNN